MNWPRFLADVIVVFHACYVGFVVFGLAAILAGLVFRWEWVRGFWFRVVHLLTIGIVTVEALLGVPCPLTTWEHALRSRAGEQAVEGDFIADWMHRLIFFRAEPWVFTVGYCLGLRRWHSRFSSPHRVGQREQPG